MSACGPCWSSIVSSFQVGLRRRQPIVPDIPSRPDAEYHLVPRREQDLFGYGAGFVLERVADGQLLSWQSLPRKEGLESVNVAGVSRRRVALQGDGFRPGKRLVLVPEPDNPHDPDAIGVWNERKTVQLGYVPKGRSRTIAKRLRAGEVWHGLSLWETVKRGERVGLRMLLYREDARLSNVPKEGYWY